jgi:hypothetical protein
MSATTTLDDEAPVASPATPTPTPTPTPPKRTRRWPFVLATLALIAVTIALFFPSILSYVAKEQALARGVVLEFDHIALTQKGAHFERATLRFVGIRGLTWSARGLDVHVTAFEPEALRATDVEVAAEGSLTDLTVDVAAWAGRYPRSLGLPFAAQRVTARWSSAAGQPPWLTLEGGTLTARGQTTALRASALTVSGVPLGGASAVWMGSETRAEIGVGSEELAKAPLRLVLGGEAGKRTAELTVALLRASELLAAFGLDVPETKATLEGKVHFVLPAELETGIVTGSCVFDIHGFTPPHPKELAGIVHGDHTRVASRFEISGDHRTVKLSDLVVEAGALKTKGGGTLERTGDYALGSFDLRGSIPCAQLSRSVGSNAGLGELGKLLGDLASQALSGSVSFTVNAKVDTRNVRALQLTPSFGVGCGLRLP